MWICATVSVLFISKFTKTVDSKDLYVDKEFRGAGIGRMLMKAAKEFAIATNSKGLALSTAKTNTLAQKLYESLGFNKDNEFYHYYLKV